MRRLLINDKIAIMNSSNTTQEEWSSKWAFILAATGAAVGLGNIWRFPYLLGSQGGSAFLFLYLFFLIILGMPILISEILIGRHTRRNAINALGHLAQQHQRSPKWQVIGWWGAGALLLVLSFYSVVSGWCMAYLWHTVHTGFSVNSPNPQTVWHQLLASPSRLSLWYTLFMILTLGVILMGVEKGLEKATKIMMPALYVVLIGLVIYALHYGNTHKAIHYLLNFNSNKITFSSVSMALGQAFFSLALGAGAMLAYGAYAPKSTSLPFAVSIIAILEVCVALLAGLAIYPLLFKYDLSPKSGPGLMFTTLPHAFAQMPAGNWVAAIFFTSLIFAAWTSSINLCEPLVMILMQKWQFSRRRATLTIGAVAWCIGFIALLSFNILKNATLAGHTLFEWDVNFPTNIMLPLGGLGYAIFTGWVLPKKISQAEINTPWFYPIWLFLIRFIAPIAIVFVFISQFIR